MHVAIHQARHQEATLKIDVRRSGSDKRPHALVVADVHNSSVANRQRLGAVIAGDGGEEDAVTVNTIGRGLRARPQRA